MIYNDIYTCGQILTMHLLLSFEFDLCHSYAIPMLFGIAEIIKIPQ